MSSLFFEELAIPEPDVNLEVGSASHGAQTGQMLIGIERELLARRPDWLLVYGDTNSTLAGALAAAKLRVPLAHVEAGLRSFNRRMPEEVNRVLTDHVSDRLLCPTAGAVRNLAAEGIVRGVDEVGDVMADAARLALERLEGRRPPLDLPPGGYYLATVHRAENTDDPARLAAILEGLGRLPLPVVWPLHPRTGKVLDRAAVPGNVRMTEPFGYLDSLAAQRSAAAVVTDSGGVQKEAYILGVPCVTLRDETEWVETIEAGWNRLAGADASKIVQMAQASPSADRPPLYGDGHAAERIVALLEEGP
jgi:UDP-N-acetylglucosamine 2-epimerase